MLKKKIDKTQMYLDVAKLHINSIKDGFLPSLGVKFLALLYRCIDEADFSTLIVKYKGAELIGFVSGTFGTSSLYKLMLAHPIELTKALFMIIFNFKKIKKIIQIYNHITGKKRGKYPQAELLTLCVHPDYRRKGIANELYKKLSNFFNSKSIFEFVIVVGQSLKANSFYINQGAKLKDTIQVHSKQNSNIFIQKI